MTGETARRAVIRFVHCWASPYAGEVRLRLASSGEQRDWPQNPTILAGRRPPAGADWLPRHGVPDERRAAAGCDPAPAKSAHSAAARHSGDAAPHRRGESISTLTGIAVAGHDPANSPDLIGRRYSRSMVRRWPGPGPAMTVWGRCAGCFRHGGSALTTVRPFDEPGILSSIRLCIGRLSPRHLPLYPTEVPCSTQQKSPALPNRRSPALPNRSPLLCPTDIISSARPTSSALPDRTEPRI